MVDMNPQSVSSEWSTIATWIAREELSLSRLLLFRIRITSKAMEQNDASPLKSMLKTLTYGRMVQGLIFNRLRMISDNYIINCDELDVIILESMEMFHLAMTEFLRMVDKHVKSGKDNSILIDDKCSQTKLLLTELLSIVWGLLESYDANRFYFATLCVSSETSKRITSYQPGWLELLSSVTNLYYQELIEQSASSPEAFSYIYKIRSFVKATKNEPSPPPALPPPFINKSMKSKGNFMNKKR